MSAGRPARLAVGVVSAGRVGAVVGAAWAAAGHHVVAASGVSRDSRAAGRRAAARTCRCCRRTRSCAGVDLALLAVPDDVLPGLVRGPGRGRLLPARPDRGAHLRARAACRVLGPATEHGVLPLALHPVMTFTGRTEDVARLAGCSVGVTATAGDEAAWSVGEALVVEMGAEPVRIAEAGPPALPRGARARRQPPGHPRPGLRRDPGAGRACTRPTGWSPRCCRPRWTTRCATATAPSPARSPAGTSRPCAPTCAELAADDPELAATYRVLAARTAGRAVAAGLLPAATAAEMRALLQRQP